MRRGAAAVAQRTDHPGAGNPFVHLEPEQAQRRRNDAGGAAFLKGEFRVRVQVATQRDEVGHQVIDRCRVDRAIR